MPPIAIHILIATPVAPTPIALPATPTAVLQTQTPASSFPAPHVPTLPAPAHLTSATVLRTVDGDTILVQLEDGTEETIRLLGVDTPETVHPNRDVECFGREATHFTENKLPPGATIFLELDTQTGERDHYGRLLAHIWIPNHSLANRHLLNLGLLTLGYATHNNYGTPPFTYTQGGDLTSYTTFLIRTHQTCTASAMQNNRCGRYHLYLPILNKALTQPQSE